MSGSHAIRQRFKRGGDLTSTRACLKARIEHPVRQEGKRQAERDLKRFELYLNVERGVSPLTVKKYSSEVKRLKTWARSKRKSLADLTITDCRRWLNSLEKELYQPSTINRTLTVAKVFLRFLVAEGDLENSPFDQLQNLKQERPLPHHLNQDEVDNLMSNPDTSTYVGLLDRVMMELLYASGVRVAELVALRVDSVNLERRLILCTGKGSKQRFVIFGRCARKWLKKYLVARDDIPGAMKSHYLFLKEDGKRIYGTYVWRRIHGHGRDAGLNNVSPHVLRHSFATHIYEGGASTQDVQKLLGHDDEQSTVTYTHLRKVHLRDTYELHHPRSGFKRGSPRHKRSLHNLEGEDQE